MTSRPAAESRSPAMLRESGAAMALIAVAVAAFILHTHFLFREPVDDAGISVSYARTFAEGHGFRITPWSAVAEGFSNPSWTLLLALIEFFGGDSRNWLRPLGIGLAGAGLVLLSLWGPVSERRRLRIEDALGPVIGAAHPSFVHWAQGGLELSMQVFTIAVIGLLGFGVHERWRASLLGATAAVLALTRPEGAIYASAAGLAWLGTMLLDRRKPGRLELRATLIAVLPLLAWFLMRRWYFGAWLPNTWYAKRNWDFNAVRYLSTFYEYYRPLCIATFLALPLGFLGDARTRVRALTTAACLASLTYFAWYARGDWMLEWRFLAPVAPFQGAVIGLAIAGMRRWLPNYGFAPAAAALAVWVLVPSELAHSEMAKAQGYDVPIVLPRGMPYQPATDIITRAGLVHPTALGSDMGVLGVGLRQSELWDVAGLTDPATSHQFNALGGLDFPSFEDYFKHEGPPTFVFAWGPGNFFRHRAISAPYVEFAPNMWIVRGLSPEEDPRCPDAKRATLALAKDALLAAIERDAHAGDPVKALARWRCAHEYQQEAQLPTIEQRSALAETIAELARKAEQDHKRELALRQFSLCAVLSLYDFRVSNACRQRAEYHRTRLYGDPAMRK